MSEGGKQSPATRNHSSLLSSYGVQRVQKVQRVQRVPVAASPPFWLTVFPYRQPSPRGEGAPKGRIGHKRYERERGEKRLKCAANESTLSTADAVPLPRWGRQISSGYAAILADGIPVRKALTKLCVKILVEADSAMESTFP